MKQVIKYAAVIFALVLAATIIGGCLTAGVTVVRMLVEKTEDSTGDSANGENNGIWYRDENGTVVFMGIRFGGSAAVKSGSEMFVGSEITSLDAEILSGEFVMKAWEQDYISVEYENVPEDYEFKNDNGTLKIRHDGGVFWFGMNLTETPKITVYVPADLEFKNVIVEKGSGSAKLSDVTATTLKVDSGSGSVSISGAWAKELRVDSGSGSVNISDVETEKMVLDSGSGSVTVKNSVLGETALDTGSGSVTFDEVTAKNLVVDSGSGRVNYTGYLTGNCVFDAASGSINLEIYGKEEDYNIRADLGSGGLYINGTKEKDTYIEYDDASNLLVFDAGSGRISIKFME